MPVPPATLSRREWVHATLLSAAAWVLPGTRRWDWTHDPDQQRLQDWSGTLRGEHITGDQGSLGAAAARTGELASGSPYQAGTLDAYLRHGGNPRSEPLTLSLTRFDCVTLVESCLAVGRAARTPGHVSWDRFGREVERMRYRNGQRRGYSSRLHYFSEWISDGQSRGLVSNIARDLGGVADDRPLRFMTTHRESYPALSDARMYSEIAAMERSLDQRPRFVVPTKCIPSVSDRIQTGDVLGFATEIPGLDATHTALAHRAKDGVLRVLHAPLSGGVVQVTSSTLAEYVAAIRHATGILLARPVYGS